MKVKVQVCSLDGCGRKYARRQFEQLTKIGIEGLKEKTTACECGWHVFNTVEEDEGPPCKTCGHFMVRGGLDWKCEWCGVRIEDYVKKGPPADAPQFLESIVGNDKTAVVKRRQKR